MASPAFSISPASLSAILMRSATVSGMRPSSIVSATTPAPCSTTSGSTPSIRAGDAFIEFTRAGRFAFGSAAASATGSALSRQRGVSTAACTVSTSHTSPSASSDPARPAFTSM